MHILRTLALIAATVGLTGCEKPCEVPPGEYEITYKVIEGDCPDELVAQFDGQTSDIKIEGGECRPFGAHHTTKLPSGCDLDTDMSASLTVAGPQDGQMTLFLRCPAPDPLTCRHLFSVEYRRKP